MLIVTGHVHVAPSDIEAFAGDVEALARATRVRDGCLSYAAVPEDAAVGRILVVERWRDQASLSAHLGAPDTADFVRRWAGRMEGEVLKYDASGGRPLDAD